ncbi:MAG: hypothetical protein AB7I08_08625 [Thermoleophilia bacterium]
MVIIAVSEASDAGVASMVAEDESVGRHRCGLKDDRLYLLGGEHVAVVRVPSDEADRDETMRDVLDTAHLVQRRGRVGVLRSSVRGSGGRPSES